MSESTTRDLQTYFLSLINRDRAAAGLAPLEMDAELNAAALRHGLAMLASNLFSHTGADGSSPSQRVTEAGYQWTRTGENIAYVGGSQAEVLDAPDVDRLHANLMNSPGHRANILGQFEHVGVGLVHGRFNGRAAVMVVQNFGTPTAAERADGTGIVVPAPVTPAPAPEPVAPTPMPVPAGVERTITIRFTGGVPTMAVDPAS